MYASTGTSKTKFLLQLLPVSVHLNATTFRLAMKEGEKIQSFRTSSPITALVLFVCVLGNSKNRVDGGWGCPTGLDIQVGQSHEARAGTRDTVAHGITSCDAQVCDVTGKW